MLRLALLTTIALGAAAAVAAGGPDADGATGEIAALKCKKGQAVWKVEGRARCITTPKVAASSPNTTRAELMVRRLLDLAVTKVPKGRATKLTAGMRRLLTRRTGNAIVAAAASTEGLARAKASAASRHAHAAVTQSVTAPEFRQTSGGTTLTGTASATVNSDTGQAAIDLGVRVAEGNASSELKIGMDLDFKDNSTVCPDASGRVEVERTSGASLTTLVRKGGNVEKAETSRVRTVTRTTGQIGPDGRTATISANQTSTVSVFRRGMEMRITTTTATSGPPGAPGTAAGTPTADAQVKLAGVGAAEARAVEREIASKVVADKTPADVEKGMSDAGRFDIEKAAANWEDDSTGSGNKCLEVVFAPTPGGQLGKGQSIPVTATLTLRNSGTPVPGATWTIPQVDIGTFTGGTGGVFTATGGEPGSSRITIIAHAAGQSIAGRARGAWYALADTAYHATMAMDETANFATHDATAKLDGVIGLTLQPGSSPRMWTGSGSSNWSQIVFTPKIPCSYIEPHYGGRWSVTLVEQADGRLSGTWGVDNETTVTESVSCPPAEPIPGQPGPRPVGVEPLTFSLPAEGGSVAVKGDVVDAGDGFHSVGTITITRD